MDNIIALVLKLLIQVIIKVKDIKIIKIANKDIFLIIKIKLRKNKNSALKIRY